MAAAAQPSPYAEKVRFKETGLKMIFTNGSKLQLLQEGHPENAFRC